MPITTYAELKAAIPNWMYRDDINEDQDQQAADFIALAEGTLNRRLRAVLVDATLAGVIGSRRIDISALQIVTPIVMYITVQGDESIMSKRADGTFAYMETAGQPSMWGVDGEAIDFNRPCDMAYPFRLRYRQRFALSDAAPTNWLLDNHPDIYLAAAIVWGRMWEDDDSGMGKWEAKLERGIPEVKRIIAQRDRGMLRVDDMLLPSNSPLRHHFYDGQF